MLQQVAHKGSQRPSELVGINCPYCAYCFDEALMARLAAEQEKAMKDELAEARIKRLKERVGIA